MSTKSPHPDSPLRTPVYRTTAVRTPADILKSLGYRQGEKIGAGAFATVYKAYRNKDAEVCACKILSLSRKEIKKAEAAQKQKEAPAKEMEGAGSVDYMDGLCNELKILSFLQHPHIIPLYFHVIIDNNMYIFMEYAPNGSLSEFVRKYGPIPEEQSRYWFKQMVDAVNYIHKKGIAHRDIKLGNILLDKHYDCKVTDFGLSRVSYRPSQGILYCTSCCGTEPYMAPEILIKKPDGTRLYDPIPADVWALGVCLYAMLNRAYPFNPQNRQTMVFNQLQRRWKFAKRIKLTVGPELTDLVSNLLEPNPKKRITLMSVRAHPWILSGKVYDHNIYVKSTVKQ